MVTRAGMLAGAGAGLVAAATLIVAPGATASNGPGTSVVPPWRFGFEYWELFAPTVTPAQHATLLDKLAVVTANQPVRGGVNVNEIGGGWATMQPTPTSPYDFSQSDPPVQTIGAKGFSVVWNLRPTAAWSQLANPDCVDGPGIDDCAPDAAHEQAWKDYIKAVVERYDGDGLEDMPGLTVPIEFYVMDQEVAFEGTEGSGDYAEALGYGFWDDSIPNLIRLHEITYEAIHEADPSGLSKLVGSGGLLFDLYSDFPNYPASNPGPGSTVSARLDGANPKGAIFRAGFDGLVQLLTALGDDSDGIKCDYIEWHPHNGWRAIDQSLALIQQYAPSKPIFVDDMWSNMFARTSPLGGWTEFIGGEQIEGDFPNATVPDYVTLADGLKANNATIVNWYNAKGARGAVKSFTTALGAGAERVSFSGSNDPCAYQFLTSCLDQQAIFGWFGYSHLLGTKATNYATKPVYYTMKLLVDELQSMTAVNRLGVSANPLTRVYKFDRPSGGPVYVAWSEAGPVPADPAVPNGETVAIPVGTASVKLTRIVTAPGQTTPATQTLSAPGNELTIQLGFEPVFLEEL
jgi:hypothetical protein